jgi:phage repressor protein C with HTH and peptisase S24 domain
LDLSLAMGNGTNIDDHIEVDTVEFDRGFLRSITPSSPNMLRLVSGVGDSMFPTLIDTDMMFIDVGQRVLNMQDRIWGISLYGAGALKRLRAIGQGKVLVISDNPAVDNQEVDAEDITIAGDSSALSGGIDEGARLDDLRGRARIDFGLTARTGRGSA